MKWKNKSSLHIFYHNLICNNFSSFMFYGPRHMAVQKQDDQHEHTFSNYVRIRDVVQKTCLRRWTIGKSGERGSGIFVLPARHDGEVGWRVSTKYSFMLLWQEKKIVHRSIIKIGCFFFFMAYQFLGVINAKSFS